MIAPKLPFTVATKDREVVTAGPSEFGVLLRKHRVEAGLSQEELAERARISARAISDLERGVYRAPKLWTARQLMEALELGDEDRKALDAAARRRPLPGAEPSPTTPAPSNLPVPATPFLGRSREIRTVREALRRPHLRLLTLTGPGGTGKTRLAIEAARDMGDAFPDGVSFVSLASLEDPALVPSVIARSLGGSEGTEYHSEQSPQARIGDRHVLLLLDNFEHLLPAAHAVLDLLAACPHLCVLVTSRVLLHLSGEHHIPVPPMSLPDSSGTETPEGLRQYDATTLFIERARAVNPSLEVTPENAPAIAAICARLDGLPLAIELAAARVTVLPPNALLERLSHGLGLLRRGTQDAPERQQTMRNTIDWSYRLLNAREQTVLARLTVFAGGCTLDAAEAVCGEGEDILDEISSLVESSLLRAGTGVDDEARFFMLETIREYGLERLRERNEEDAVRRRHAEYYLDLAERVYEDSSSARVGPPAMPSKFQLVDQEHDNLAGALVWLRDHQEWVLAMRFVSAIATSWNAALRFSELTTWFNALAPYRDQAPLLVRARFLLPFAYHRLDELDLEGTIEPEPRLRWIAVIEEAVSLYREAGNEWLLLRALIAAPYFMISHANWPPGVYEKAERLFTEALELGRRLGSSHAVAAALQGLADMADRRGDRGRAIELFEEALAIERAGGHTDLLADTLGPLALKLAEQGDTVRADALLREALALHLAAGNKFAFTFILGQYGAGQFLRGNHAKVITVFREVWQAAVEFGIMSRFGIDGYFAGWLTLVAGSAPSTQARSAALLFGAADRVLGTELPTGYPEVTAALQARRAEVRAQLGESAWTAACEEGHALTLEQAIEFALQL